MPTGMRRRFARTAARAARRLGGDIGEVGELGGIWSIPRDCDAATAAIIGRVQAYTLTPPARIMALCAAVRDVVNRETQGAIVECGVWRGGSMMAAALTLLEAEAADRDLWLYDTFTEMPPPGEHDQHLSGHDMTRIYEETGEDPVYAIYSDERIRELLVGTGYPPEHLHLVRGMVEETVPAKAPERIAICRLDTDWYESTRHELEHLYPRISAGGFLIVDDYGEFLGARKAVDEYLATLESPPFLSRIDASCRLATIG